MSEYTEKLKQGVLKQMNGDSRIIYDYMKESDRKNDEAHIRIEDKVDEVINKTMDKSMIKWLIAGSFGFSMVILGLVLKLHLGV